MPFGVAAAAVGAAGSIAGSALSSGAASSASKAQQATSMAALASQNAQWAYNQQQELPYIAAGTNALTRNQDLLDSYNGTVQPQLNNLLSFGQGTQAQAALEQTPGYQFTLAQGLKSTQNAAAARGLGVSGAALKGAAAYSTGLADSTYNQQFSNALTSYSAAADSWKNQFSANNNLALIGENAAVGSGTQGQAMSTNTSNLLTGSGNAQAASTIASGNTTQSGINGVSNSLSNALLNPQVQAYLKSSFGTGSQYDPAAGTAQSNALTGQGVY